MREDAIDISILLIYTGGTIGMIEDPETGTLKPFEFESITQKLPEIRRFGYTLDTISFQTPIDSANMNVAEWVKMVEIIEDNYYQYDGFVIMHGTDTMAYSASALSFLLENLNKPVIFTGSQLPFDQIRTDARENLIASVEIAAAKTNKNPNVPEVGICFENKLYRGNRTSKVSSEMFNAFSSYNYPLLAESGVYMKYNFSSIHPPDGYQPFKVHKKMDPNVAILKIYPGISEYLVTSILETPGLKGLVLETFGSGTAPDYPWFIKLIRKAIERGIYILNVSQCRQGNIIPGRYKTGYMLLDAGVIGGYDITTEAAITKMMFVLGLEDKKIDKSMLLKNSLRGEITT